MSKKEQLHDTLGNRLKQYEALSTSRQLMPNTPVYARIDGRAFHTFCRGLEKPFSKAFILVMQETCKFLVKETNACLGYVQSDEISLGWENIVKAPFDGRVQKLESSLASLASARFIYTILRGMVRGIENEYDLDTMLAKVDQNPPSFDCRVFNVPTMTELANCFLWRENDAIKNSISGMSLHFYSHKELQNKNSDEKIHMMRMKGHCFYEDTDPAFMRGTFYHRENYLKALTDEEVARIPEKQRENLEYSKNGYTLFLPNDRIERVKPNIYYCWRSHIVPMNLPYRLTETADLEKVLFSGLAPECKIENPTFNLSKREEV
jgi:tRNA(His) 5'-end guanylyltransferase